jgi:hypothetical protein
MITETFERNDRWKYLIFFLVFSLVIYWPTLFGEPFWDDWVFIFKNFMLQLEHINPLSFFISDKEVKSWPVFYSIIWGMLKLFKNHYFFYHLTNIVVHSLNGFMLFKILSRFRVANPILWALLYIAHPIHLFTVSWIIQLKTVTSILFFLFSINYFTSYLKDLKTKNYILFILFFILSLLTKSTVAGLAVVICISFPLFKDKIPFKKFTTMFLIPLFLVGGLALYRTSKLYHLNGQLSKEEILSRKNINFSDSNITDKPTEESLQPGEQLYFFIGTTDKILLSAKNFSRYVAYIFLPLNTAQLFHERTNLTFISIEFLAIFFVVSFFLYSLKVLYEKKYFLELSGIYFFFVTLFPFCGVVFLPIFSYSNFVPYWLSIPLLGLIPVGSRYITSKNTLLCIVLIAGIWTHWQTYQFINTEDLFIESIKREPNKFIYKVSLVEYYVNTYQCEKAKNTYETLPIDYNPKLFNLEEKVKFCPFFRRDKK